MKQEFILILILAFSCRFYFQTEPLPINSDGKGYYDYLPALFIYHDLSWTFLDTLKTDNYDHANYPGIYNELNNRKVNKYFVGTPLLMSPFFGIACLYDYVFQSKINGYSSSFQVAIYFASLFYLWLGLLYLRKLLENLEFEKSVIFITQILIVFATPIVYYTYYQPSYSHIYSFASICVFMYYGQQYIQKKENSKLILLSFLLGIICLIRPTNLLIVLIIPFLFSSPKEAFKFFIAQIRKYYWYFSVSLIIFFLIISIQLVFWHLQTGHFIIDSYSEESFNFSTPEIFNILFSYKKGLFVYSPILFIITIGGIFAMVREKSFFKLSSLLLVLFVATYVLSSWWCWYYSSSFGQRSFIDFLPLFAILSAYFFRNLKQNIRLCVSIFSIIFICITFIQIDQYSKYILSWEGMDKEKYWMVFLKTQDKYRGMLWNIPINYSEDKIVNKVNDKTKKTISVNDWCGILDVTKDSLKDENVSTIHIKANLNLNESNPKVYLNILDSLGNSLLWQEQFAFTGIKQHFFYEEIYQGEGNYYFTFELPKNYSKITAGFATESKIIIVNDYDIFLIRK